MNRCNMLVVVAVTREITSLSRTLVEEEDEKEEFEIKKKLNGNENGLKE